MNFKHITFYICLLISSYTFGQVDQKINLTDTTFKVFGVCEQCKDRIEGALKLKGISKAIWDIDSKIIPVDGDIFYTDKTHSVILIETDYMEKLYRQAIEDANDKINFIRFNKNRNEKLNDLLDES
jgi:hypothetical protein